MAVRPKVSKVSLGADMSASYRSGDSLRPWAFTGSVTAPCLYTAFDSVAGLPMALATGSSKPSRAALGGVKKKSSSALYTRPVGAIAPGTFIYDTAAVEPPRAIIKEHTHFDRVVTYILGVVAWLIIVATFPFSLFFCLKIVSEYERAVIFRLGTLVSSGPKGPGLFFILPCIDTCRLIDLRTTVYDVPPQEVLSKDSVSVTVDAVVYYRTSDPIAATTNVNDASYSTKLLAQTTLRNVLGMKTLSEMLSDRETIAASTQKTLDESTDHWGIKVERVEMKDIRLPANLTRAMAAEAEAAREARAQLIMADGEQRASYALRLASDILHSSPTALRLRQIQTMVDIASEHGSTILFPIAMNFSIYRLKNVFGRKSPDGPKKPQYYVPTGELKYTCPDLQHVPSVF